MKQNIPQNLLKKIAEYQVKYHITGGQVEDEIIDEHETATGTTIRYIAKRIWACRGLSYIITRETISIARGFKSEYVNTTHEWGREEVMLRQ